MEERECPRSEDLLGSQDVPDSLPPTERVEIRRPVTDSTPRLDLGERDSLSTESSSTREQGF